MMSSFNVGVFISNWKRFWWVSALYTIFLFFIVPLRMIMETDMVQNEHIRDRLFRTLDITSAQSQPQLILLWLVPVIVSVLVFRYLQVGNVAAFMHSLPLTRKTLFISNVCSGLSLLILPIVINSGILIFLRYTTELDTVFTVVHILAWLGYSMLFILIMFAFATFVGMFTGSTAAQMVFNYILHLLPLGLYYLIEENLFRIIHGYSRAGLDEPTVLEKLPLTVMGYSEELNDLIVWYILVAILFLLAGYYVYKFRPIEVAGEIISFSIMKPVFKYGVTACSMLLGGAYFASISDGNNLVIIIGYIVTSLIGYAIAEMLIQKTYKVLNAYKGYLIYTVVVMLIFVGIQMDLTGFAGRVPDEQDIEGVYFAQGLYEYRQIQEDKLDPSEVSGYFQEGENISTMRDFHLQLIDLGHRTEGNYYYLVYVLQNGEHLIREYRIEEDKFGSDLRSVYESLEYKKGEFPILTQNSNEVNSITLGDERKPENQKEIQDQNEVNELIRALQKDIKDLKYEDLADRWRVRDYIYMTVRKGENETQRYGISNNYEQTINWLQEQGYYQEVVVTPQDLDMLVLEKDSVNISEGSDADIGENQIEIDNSDLIEEILEISGQGSHAQVSEFYMVSFYFSGEESPGFRDQIQIDDEMKESLSDELAEKLKRLE